MSHLRHPNPNFTETRLRVERLLAEGHDFSATEVAETLLLRLDEVQNLFDVLVTECLLQPVRGDLFRRVTPSELAESILKGALPASYDELIAHRRDSPIWAAVVADAVNILFVQGKVVVRDGQIHPVEAPEDHVPADLGPVEENVLDALCRGNFSGRSLEDVAEDSGHRTPEVKRALQILVEKGRARTKGGLYLPTGPERDRAVAHAVRAVFAVAPEPMTPGAVAIATGYPSDEVNNATEHLYNAGLLGLRVTGYVVTSSDIAAGLLRSMLPETLGGLFRRSEISDALWERVVLRGLTHLFLTGAVRLAGDTIHATTSKERQAPAQPTALVDYVNAARVVVERTRHLLRGLGLRADNALDEALSKLDDLSESEIVGTDVAELRKEIKDRDEKIEALAEEVEGFEDSVSTLVGQIKDVLRRHGRRRPY